MTVRKVPLSEWPTMHSQSPNPPLARRSYMAADRSPSASRFFSNVPDHGFDLLTGRCPAEAEPNRAHSDLRGHSHGLQDGGQRYRSGMARGTGRRGHSGQAPQNLRTNLSHEAD